MFYEWSQVIKKTNSFDGYKKGDEIYYPFVDKKNNLLLIKAIIDFIEYDSAAPRQGWEGAVAICKKRKGLFFSEYIEVPLYLLSKDKNTTRALFMKFDSKHLKNIKIRKGK